ncbi:MAG TPA: flagellar hook capping FlgD N-terminal domain-containing protein [Candidatus Baltobacteraceae bacterium]|jgi:flagellar basal-body rod modification protein FlgD
MAGVGTTAQSPLVTQTSTTPGQSGTGQTLGATAFLSLLTTELQNQDPLNPMDSTQSVTQLAQFQALQSQVTLADSFQSFQNNFSISQAASLIGLTVAVNTTDGAGNTSTQTGIVSGIQIVNGTPEFALTSLSTGQIITGSDGSPALYQMNQITAVVPTGSSSTSSGG